MKMITLNQSRTGLATFATVCALALGLASTSASAVFVDYEHSAEGLKYSPTSPGYRAPKPSSVFVDYDHTAEAVDPSAPASWSEGRSGTKSPFVDW